MSLCLEFDKSKWGEGPWQTEPDILNGEYKGYKYLVLRNHRSHFCGYIAFESQRGEPNYENSQAIDCHGGITYDEPWDDFLEMLEVMNIKELFPHPGIRVIGFDCAQSCDYLPASR